MKKYGEIGFFQKITGNWAQKKYHKNDKYQRENELIMETIAHDTKEFNKLSQSGELSEGERNRYIDDVVTNIDQLLERKISIKDRVLLTSSKKVLLNAKKYPVKKLEQKVK
jgi:hypothetical protein